MPQLSTFNLPLSTLRPGARPYHSTASVWLSVDPLSDKYPSVSPYVYCANNPVRLVDPDGREIWIIGEDGNRYRYYKGNLYNSNNEIITDVDQSLTTITNGLNQISTSKMGKSMVNKLQNSKEYNVTIQLSSSTSNYSSIHESFDANGNFIRHCAGKILWNPQTQVPVSPFGQLETSGIFGLAHELSHAYDDCTKNPLTNVPDKMREWGSSARSAAETFAMYRENCVRLDCHSTLRSHYEAIGNDIDGFRGGGQRAINPISLSVSTWFLGKGISY